MGFIEKPQLKGGWFKTKTSRENTMSEELSVWFVKVNVWKKNSITHGVLKMPQFGEVSLFYYIEYSWVWQRLVPEQNERCHWILYLGLFNINLFGSCFLILQK